MEKPSEKQQKIKQLVDSTDISLKKLSEKSGVDYAHVNRIYNGKNNPGPVVFERLIRILEGEA